MADSAKQGPLSGYKIIDCTTMVSGPFASMILGDQGAEVIKVEVPGIGDPMRLLGTQRNGMGMLFALQNRSKKSLVVNMREETGRELVRKLISEADVFMHNYRPGVTDRLGIDEKAMRALNKDLVYVSINAYGDEGPYSHKPAYDHILQGITGFSAVQKQPEADKPEFVRNLVCDKGTALTVAQGITAALLARERGQGGQHIQTTMLEASIAFLWPDGGMNASVIEEDTSVLPPLSNSFVVREAADGFFSLAAVTDAQFHGLYRAIGRPELCEDPKFATAAGRMANYEEMRDALYSDDFHTRPRAEVLALLESEDVPCGPVYSDVIEVLSDPQVKSRGTFTVSEHPQMGRMHEPRPPVSFNGERDFNGAPAPALGANTDEVLLGEGMSESEISALREAGIVA